jgi:serine/threonine-protein kinase
LSQEAEEAEARVGTVLNDKWKLERLLGVGGMGAVYASLHRNGARGAVKVLHRSLAKLENVRARFLREGYAANKVDRAGVVKVLDDDVVQGGADEGTAYLVMELLSGQSLGQRARAAPRSSRGRTRTASSTATSSPRTSSSRRTSRVCGASSSSTSGSPASARRSR